MFFIQIVPDSFQPTIFSEKIDTLAKISKDMARFVFRDSLSLTNVQGNMMTTNGLSGLVA
jgi:hypothetical protein